MASRASFGGSFMAGCCITLLSALLHQRLQLRCCCLHCHPLSGWQHHCLHCCLSSASSSVIGAVGSSSVVCIPALLCALFFILCVAAALLLLSALWQCCLHCCLRHCLWHHRLRCCPSSASLSVVGVTALSSVVCIAASLSALLFVVCFEAALSA